MTSTYTHTVTFYVGIFFSLFNNLNQIDCWRWTLYLNSAFIKWNNVVSTWIPLTSECCCYFFYSSIFKISAQFYLLLFVWSLCLVMQVVRIATHTRFSKRRKQWVVIFLYNWREICVKDWYQFNWNVWDRWVSECVCVYLQCNVVIPLESEQVTNR